ncbi:ribonuclease H-like domain-containing protein [Tanacetum coccineum]
MAEQHQNEVNEIRAERLVRTANLLALVAQQQLVCQPQPNPTHYSQDSSTRSQAATINRGKAIVTSTLPTYDLEPEVVTDDEANSKKKEIDKLVALISLARENVGTQVVQQTGIQCFNCKEFGHVVRECKKLKRARDSTYHKEKMMPCKQEEVGIQLSVEQADWRDDSDDVPKNQELEAHYMYMEKVQEVIPEDADNSGLEKVHTTNDNYNVFANERQHPKQPEIINDTYVAEQDDSNISPDSSNMCGDEREAYQDDTDQECVLLASLIEKLKCKIDENKK